MSNKARQHPGRPTSPKRSDTSIEKDSRRRLLKVALGASLTAPAWMRADAAKPANKMRPQPGDLIVYRFGEKQGQPIASAAIEIGQDLIQAVSKDPETDVVRDGSRLNGINVVRIETTDLDAQTAPHSTDGIVAYSSVCTHQGCDLTQWITETRTFKCYCHYSEFDASQLGQPRHGPAKRKLAILPLTTNDNKQLVVAEKFQGKVGFKKR